VTIANKILKNHHLHLSEQEINHLTDEKNKLFVHLIKHGLTPNDVINGVDQLINDAISRGLQLVAISSSSNAELEMKQLGLYDKFTYVSSYNEAPFINSLRKEKETVSPLTFVLKKLVIRPEECIGLEDHIDGIIEYKQAGIFAVAIAHYHEDIKKEADH
jgi:beta-phosphoglucomutase